MAICISGHISKDIPGIATEQRCTECSTGACQWFGSNPGVASAFDYGSTNQNFLWQMVARRCGPSVPILDNYGTMTSRGRHT